MFQIPCKEHEFVVVEVTPSTNHVLMQCRRCGVLKSSTKELEFDGKDDYAVVPEQSVEPPFPDKMSFEEMYLGLFNRDFLSDEEFKTLCDAAEMYANGCLKQAATPDSREEGKGVTVVVCDDPGLLIVVENDRLHRAAEDFITDKFNDGVSPNTKEYCKESFFAGADYATRYPMPNLFTPLPAPVSDAVDDGKMQNCLGYALRFWEKNPEYLLYYNSGHVINSNTLITGEGWLPAGDYGYNYFKSSFAGLLDEYETQLLTKYFNR